jgi:ribosomal protein S7
MVYKKKFEEKKKNPFFILHNKFFNRGLSVKGFNICLSLLSKLKLILKKDNKLIFKKFFNFISLYVYLYKKKIGGNVYTVPLYIKKELRLKKGLSNFLSVLENKKEHNFIEKIFKEILDVLKLKGSTINTRNNIYMTAADEKTNIRYVVSRDRKKKKVNINYKEKKNQDGESFNTLDKFENFERKSFK